MQPPSGGCVLKPLGVVQRGKGWLQPPSGGCVLKLLLWHTLIVNLMQPPSGGCVLKRKERELRAEMGKRSRLRAAVC